MLAGSPHCRLLIAVVSHPQGEIAWSCLLPQVGMIPFPSWCVRELAVLFWPQPGTQLQLGVSRRKPGHCTLLSQSSDGKGEVVLIARRPQAWALSGAWMRRQRLEEGQGQRRGPGTCSLCVCKHMCASMCVQVCVCADHREGECVIPPPEVLSFLFFFLDAVTGFVDLGRNWRIWRLQ